MGKEIIGEALADMLDENTQSWGLRRFREMHPRIVAVMFHLAAPWDVGGERLIHLSTANFVETGNNPTLIWGCDPVAGRLPVRTASEIQLQARVDRRSTTSMLSQRRLPEPDDFAKPDWMQSGTQ